MSRECPFFYACGPERGTCPGPACIDEANLEVAPSRTTLKRPVFLLQGRPPCG